MPVKPVAAHWTRKQGNLNLGCAVAQESGILLVTGVLGVFSSLVGIMSELIQSPISYVGKKSFTVAPPGTPITYERIHQVLASVCWEDAVANTLGSSLKECSFCGRKWTNGTHQYENNVCYGGCGGTL